MKVYALIDITASAYYESESTAGSLIGIYSTQEKAAKAGLANLPEDGEIIGDNLGAIEGVSSESADAGYAIIEMEVE